MKRTNFFIAALAISLAACNSGKSNLGYEIVTLQEEKLPPVQQLQLEKIDLQMILNLTTIINIAEAI